MCSTCNHTTYDKIGEKPNERLEQSLGFGSLLIRCDLDGKNYRLAVKDQWNSEFKLYACPTCQKKLW